MVLTDSTGAQHDADRVVVATHADEALRLLSDPTDDEFDLLSPFRYSSNVTQLHRDDSVLQPRVASAPAGTSGSTAATTRPTGCA